MPKKRIVILTQEMDPHADQMVLTLQKRGVNPIRFHTKDFPLKTRFTIKTGQGSKSSISISTDDWSFSRDGIHSIWNRRPDAPGLDPQLSDEEKRMAFAECNASLLNFYRISNCFWINHPDKNRVASSKTLQLEAARTLGFRIPDTLLTNDPAEVRNFFDAHRGNIVFKLQRATIWSDERALAIYTSKVGKAQMEKLDLLRHAPGLFQEYIPKRVELRITIIGNKVFAVALHSQEVSKGSVDWRKATRDIRHEKFKLPSLIEKRLLRLTRNFGLQYAAIDMIVTPENEFIFLELNPNGQFGWIEDAVGYPLYETLADLLISGKSTN
jgi:glutathione synthase/RimK-type ligase-like ATP-grasp enzyme